MGSIFSGLGVEYPDTKLTNADLEKIVETTEDWIVTRTGIRERHILPKDSKLQASDLGVAAARKALAQANLAPMDIDAILVGNIVPDKQFPATACIIQDKLGAKKAFAFDLTAACAGFVFGVNLADNFIRTGQCRHVLVIGAEILSRVVDWTDRNTCILFGDAAGAAIISAGPQERGIINSKLHSDGAYGDILYLDTLVGPDSQALIHSAAQTGKPGLGMRMDGKSVFKLAVTEVSKVVETTLKTAGYSIHDIDLLFLHQANVRILQGIGDKLGLPPEKVVMNVERFGNTSSASIPLALHEAQLDGRLKPGALVVLAAVGGGMSWGCNIVRW
jgi:3-oxoacyl-[acyl-carrier-protein] synthase III